MFVKISSVFRLLNFPNQTNGTKDMKIKNSLIFSVFPLKCTINVNGKIINFDVFLNLNIFGPICPIWEV